MSSRVEYSTLSRLLALNNQVHDLEHELNREVVPVGKGAGESLLLASRSRVAALQEEIDQGVRASLMTCWLSMPEED